MKIGLLFAFAPKDNDGLPTAPAIKHGGYSAAATVRIVSYRDRVAGMNDAIITLDADQWFDGDWDDPEKLALLDHELTHLKIVEEEDGKPKLDKAGRPKLKMRMHDQQFGWFDDVAKRHGHFSHEVRQARKMQSETGQLYFQFDLEIVKKQAA